MNDKYTLLNIEANPFVDKKTNQTVNYFRITLLTKTGILLKGTATQACYEKTKDLTAQNIVGIATIELYAGNVRAIGTSGKEYTQDIVKMRVLDFIPD